MSKIKDQRPDVIPTTEVYQKHYNCSHYFLTPHIAAKNTHRKETSIGKNEATRELMQKDTMFTNCNASSLMNDIKESYQKQIYQFPP